MSDVSSDLITFLHGVIEQLGPRAQFGQSKYGTPLLPFNGRNPLKDRREELLDALVYTEQDILERAEVADLLEKAGHKLAATMTKNSADEDWFFVGTLHGTAISLRADVPRIGVPATHVLSDGPMARLEDMEKS